MHLWSNQFREHVRELILKAHESDMHLSFQNGNRGNALIDIIYCFIAKSIELSIPLEFMEKVKNKNEISNDLMTVDINEYFIRYFRNLVFKEPICLHLKTKKELVVFLEELNWGDPWNEINIVGTILKSFIDNRQKEYVKLVFEFIRDLFAIDNTLTKIKSISSTQLLGIWSHLCPFESATGMFLIERNKKTFDFVINQQHEDHHFYPVAGGGACPNLNAVNILLTFCIGPGSILFLPTTRYRLALLNSAILSNVHQTLLPDSFRNSPLTEKQIKYLTISDEIKHWITCKEIFEIGSKTELINLHKPDVWSTWIWLLTVKKINILLRNKSHLKASTNHFSFGIHK